MELDKDLKSRQEVRDLVNRANAAAKILAGWDQAQIDRVVKAISDAGLSHAKELAELACSETGFGNVPDKIKKNEFAAGKVYEAICHQRTVGIIAEHPEEIDRKRAEAAKKRAEERLRQKQSIREYYHSKAALARAMARLKTRR